MQPREVAYQREELHALSGGVLGCSSIQAGDVQRAFGR